MSFPSTSCSLFQPHPPPHWLFFNTLSTFPPQDHCTCCSHCLEHVSISPSLHTCRLASSLLFSLMFRCHLITGIFPDRKYLNIYPYINNIPLVLLNIPLYFQDITICRDVSLCVCFLGPMRVGPQSVLFSVSGSVPQIVPDFGWTLNEYLINLQHGKATPESKLGVCTVFFCCVEIRFSFKSAFPSS